MSSTAFVNGSTLTDASWFNDVNIATYSVLGDTTTAPATAIAAMKNLFKKGVDIPSAGTTNLAAATGNYVHITGTTTITALGTVNSGVPFWLVFDGALTLTYNASSLILPGAVNITTVAGDTALFVSEGSGNWKCIHYNRGGTSAVPTDGSWTPGVTFGNAAVGLTLSSTTGGYTKSGRMVFAWYEIIFSAKGSSTGTARMTGFPFSPAANTNHPVAHWVTLGTTWVNVQLEFLNGAITAIFQGSQTAATSNNQVMTATDFSNSTILRGILVYPS